MLIAFLAALALLFFRSGVPSPIHGFKLKARPHVSFTVDYDEAFPGHAQRIHDACDRFSKAYDASFSYPSTPLCALDLVRALYSIHEDATIACGEIRMRLPNDLVVERKFVQSYEDLDRRMNELIEDAKSRLGVFVHPGPLSTAFQAKKYRASNDTFR